MAANIKIRAANQSDLSPALSYVQSRYHRKFGTEPKSLGEDCLIAEMEANIVGVMVLHFSTGGEFDFESQFLLNFSLLEKSRLQTVSFSRWVANHSGVGIGLMFAAIRLALGRGAAHSLSCARPDTLRALRRKYSLPLDMLHFPIRRENIPSQDMKYFLANPSPCLCAASLGQWYDRLESIQSPDLLLDF